MAAIPAPLHYDLILVRYGEIGLKSRPVRRRFEQALQANIERAFEQEGVDVVGTRSPGRLILATQGVPRALPILARIFGITSVSPVRAVPSDLPTLLAGIRAFFEEAAAQRPDAKTFALRVRRSGQHAYTSQDIARQGGGAVLSSPSASGWRVNLDAPDLAIEVEIRDNQAYLFVDRVEGPGGLPMGTQGKVVVLLKDLHSLIAAWLMMKRGCTVVPVTFTGPTGNPDRAHAFLEVLRRWYFHGDLVEVPHEEAREFPQREACVLCMRQMIRKADLVAKRRHAKGIVTGEAFTSTTVENLTQFGGLASVPVLRPLLGMTPSLVGDFAQRVGVEAGRAAPFQEPCPLRTPGRVDESTTQRLEAELGHEAVAFDAIRHRTILGVKA